MERREFFPRILPKMGKALSKRYGAEAFVSPTAHDPQAGHALPRLDGYTERGISKTVH
jgi:hypothetical protein